MILILSNLVDEVALALHRLLREQAVDTYLVTAADLVFAPYWRHEVSEAGKASTVIRLQNGLLIESTKVQAVFNRLTYLEAVHFMNETDRTYAEMEFTALYFSFLKSIEHALPMPLATEQLMPGGRSELEVWSAAIDAGLPVLDTHFTSSPRWKQTVGMLAMSPIRKSRRAFFKQSPHLVWEDKPIRQVAHTSSVVKAVVAGGQIICDRRLPFEPGLLLMTRSLGSSFLQAYFGENGEGLLFLYEVDLEPVTASPEALEAIAEALLHKIPATA